MGINVLIGNRLYEASNYSVAEDATPLASGDSAGGVGSFTFTIPMPDRDIDPDHPLIKLGVRVLDKAQVFLMDELYGDVHGRVTSVALAEDSQSLEITGHTGLGDLNAYNVRALPQHTTLGAAFSYYCGLAGVTGVTDSRIAGKQVTFPGFHGELWFNLKQMAAAVQAEIVFRQGQVVLQPIRERKLPSGFEAQLNYNVNSENLAQSVEVTHYESSWVNPGLVYPVGGWNEEVEVLSVAAGEYVEHEIPIDASLVSIVQPTMVQNVSRDHVSSSVYSVVADDGFTIPPAQWHDRGGRLSVEIGEDTSTLIVKIQAPNEFRISDGTLTQSFDIAMAADTTGSRYSSLRIIGTGMVYRRNTLVIPTGVPASATGTDVGVTIDNPFITSLETAYEAGGLAAAQFAGSRESLTLTAYAPPEAFETFGVIVGSRVSYEGRIFRVRSVNVTPDQVGIEADYDGTVGDFDDFFAGKTIAEIEQYLAQYPQYNDEVGEAEVILKPQSVIAMPRRNLPGEAEVWGREVENRIANLSATTDTLSQAIQVAQKQYTTYAGITAKGIEHSQFITTQIEEVQEEVADLSSDLDDELNELNDVVIPGIEGELADAAQKAQEAVDAALAAETTANGANARLTYDPYNPAYEEVYEWEGGIPTGRSSKIVNGVLVARNLARNPGFENSTVGWDYKGFDTPGGRTDGAPWEGGAPIQGQLYGRFPSENPPPLSESSQYVRPLVVNPAGTPWVGVSFFAGGVPEDGGGEFVVTAYASRTTFDQFYPIASGHITSEGGWVSGIAEIPPDEFMVTFRFDRPMSLYAMDAVRVDAAETEHEIQKRMEYGYFDGDTPDIVVPTEDKPSTRRNGTPLEQGDELMIHNRGKWTGVEVWNGEEWVPHQIVADSLLVPGSAGATVIADGAITTPKLVANAVTTPKLNALAVSADKLAANAVTTAKLDALAITAKHTITGATLQTTSSPSYGIKITTSGFSAYSPQGLRTVFISSGSGNVEIAGSFRTGLGDNQTVISDNIYRGRPGIKFDTGSSSEIEPTIQSLGSGSEGFPAGAFVLTGREATANTSGRADIVLEHGGDFYIAQNHGSQTGVGVHKVGWDLELLGRTPGPVTTGFYGGVYRNESFVGAALSNGQSITYTSGSPRPSGTNIAAATVHSGAMGENPRIGVSVRTASQVGVNFARDNNTATTWSLHISWIR